MVQRNDHWTLRWWFAAKPKSWGKLLVPALLGQSLGVVSAGRVEWSACWFGFGMVLANLLSIVFLNDYGDRDIDAGKRKMFPRAGSKKTIPDGILPASSLLWAGCSACLAMLVLAWCADQQLERPWLIVFVCVAIFSIWAYTFAPIRLNYRGGGEVIEALGVGLFVPWIQSYIQSGTLAIQALLLFPTFLLWSSASAIASGLSDEISDRSGGKVTVATIFGNEFSRRWLESLLISGIILLAIVAANVHSLVSTLLSPWVLWLAIGAGVSHWVWLRQSSHLSGTMAFAHHGQYKVLLHRGIWLPQLIVISGLWAAFLLQ